MPIGSGPNVRLGGAIVNAGAAPVPDSETVKAPAASVVTVRTPARGPTAVGAKVTRTTQLARAVTLDEQPFST